MLGACHADRDWKAKLRAHTTTYCSRDLRRRTEKVGAPRNVSKGLVAVDQQVGEIATRLEERQVRRDRGTDGDIIQTMGMVFAQERHSAREEFKTADREMQRALEAKLAAVEERLKAVPGKLPVAKIWQAESVTYEGEIVGYEGSLYQARQDTAQTPGGSDWNCVARRGHDGCDGRTPNVCGLYDAFKTYAALDIVTRDGNAFIACKDDPGDCPGPYWEVLSLRGKPGDKGPPGARGKTGARGERGEATPMVVAWTVDRRRYCAIPTLSNGKGGAVLDLRPLFEQFVIETGAGQTDD